MIKAVLFDFFGVLVEGGREGAIRQVFAQAYNLDSESLRFEDIGLEALKGDVSDEEFINRMNLEHPDGRRVSVEDFRTAASNISPSTHIYYLAKLLRGYGIKTAILSNILKCAAEILRNRGMYSEFDPVLLSCETGFAKPEQAAYRQALDQLGCAPEEVIFIDDQQVFLDPAKTLGMHTVLAVTPEQIADEVKSLLLDNNGIRL